MGFERFPPQNRYPVRHLQGFFDMKIPLPAVGAFSAVIVDPVSDIGILLDLRDQVAAADGMYGAGLDEKHISFLHLYFV